MERIAARLLMANNDVVVICVFQQLEKICWLMLAVRIAEADDVVLWKLEGIAYSPGISFPFFPHHEPQWNLFSKPLEDAFCPIPASILGDDELGSRELFDEL